MQPSVGIARGVTESETGRGIILLQRLAQFKETGEILREFLEASLVHRRFAVGHVPSDGRDGDA